MTVERVLRTATEATRLLGALAVEWLRTGIVFNPIAERHREDPYPFYRRLRTRDPIHRSWAAYGWVVSRHRDVVEVLRDPRFSADDRNFSQYPRLRAQRIRDGLADPDREPAPVMLRIDPPDHTRLRSLVSKAFTPRAVARLRPRIEEITATLLDGLAGRDGFDVVADFAVPLPVTVIAEMLGIPAEDRATFKRWSDVLVGFLDPVAAPAPAVMRTTVEEFFAYVGRIAAERRARPADDLLSALVAAEDAGEKLSEEELHGTVALLLAAGNETTTNLIGNGLLALLRHPDELARLRGDPGLIERAGEELLRYDSPVQLTGRIAKEDVDFHGARFRAGQNVILLLGAANRDPEVFPDPDRLDLGRPAQEHLSFGLGHHFCLGAPLARLEAHVALGELVRRFPRLRLADDRIPWGRFSFLRGPRALRVLV
jgi:cytochrome P450